MMGGMSGMSGMMGGVGSTLGGMRSDNYMMELAVKRQEEYCVKQPGTSYGLPSPRGLPPPRSLPGTPRLATVPGPSPRRTPRRAQETEVEINSATGMKLALPPGVKESVGDEAGGEEEVGVEDEAEGEAALIKEREGEEGEEEEEEANDEPPLEVIAYDALSS